MQTSLLQAVNEAELATQQVLGEVEAHAGVFGGRIWGWNMVTGHTAVTIRIITV